MLVDEDNTLTGRAKEACASRAEIGIHSQLLMSRKMSRHFLARGE